MKTDARSNSVVKLENQRKILALLATGVAPYEACRMVGVKPNTYCSWFKRDKAFVDKVRSVRLTMGDGDLPGIGFVEFREAMFGHPTAVHHYRMIEAIERAKPDSITMTLSFPESAKTSLLVDRVNYVLGPVDPNYRFCVISEGQDLSRKIVNQVTNRMVDEQQFGAYIAAFGPFKAPDRSISKPWNADYVQVLKARNDEKEPSLEARGAGSKLYGGRYDEMHLDDIQSSESLNQTPQLLRYIRQTVLTRPAKGVGRTFYWGSRVGVGDVPDTMLEEGMVNTLIEIPALSEWLNRDEHFYVDKNNEVHLVPECPEISTWPEWWSMLQLAVRRKQVGEEIWARTYMQRRVADAAASFTDEMIENVKDRDRVLGLPASGGLGVGRVMSIDPAMDSGICAFGSFAYSANKLWLLDLLERTDVHRYEDIYEQVGLWAMRYRPNVVIVEQNNFQKGLHQDDRMLALSRKFGFELVPHQTSRNKNDPVIGVKMMASAFIDKELSIPWGDEATIQKMGVLCDELRNWRPKQKIKQNTAMVLWFAWLYWEQERQQMGLILPEVSGVPSWAKQTTGVPSWARGA